MGLLVCAHATQGRGCRASSRASARLASTAVWLLACARLCHTVRQAWCCPVRRRRLTRALRRCRATLPPVLTQCSRPKERPAAWPLLRGLCMGLPCHKAASSALRWPDWRPLADLLTQACVATMQAHIAADDKMEALITVRGSGRLTAASLAVRSTLLLTPCLHCWCWLPGCLAAACCAAVAPRCAAAVGCGTVQRHMLSRGFVAPGVWRGRCGGRGRGGCGCGDRGGRCVGCGGERRRVGVQRLHTPQRHRSPALCPVRQASARERRRGGHGSWQRHGCV